MTGYQIKLIDINFNLQKSLEILGKKSADKIQSKKIKGLKVPSLMTIRVKNVCSSNTKWNLKTQTHYLDI